MKQHTATRVSVSTSELIDLLNDQIDSMRSSDETLVPLPYSHIPSYAMIEFNSDCSPDGVTLVWVEPK